MADKLKVKCCLVKPNDTKLIDRLAGWYLEAWAVPKERTIARLRTFPNDEVMVQLVLKEGNKVIATGGLYLQTSLSIIFPKYQALAPWISQLYIEKEYRRKGYGTLLLQMLEEYALKAGISHVYLFTSIAPKFLIRNGYHQIERLKYKSTDTMVMEKDLT